MQVHVAVLITVLITVLNLILCMEKNFNFEKRVFFLVKVVNRSIYINVMRIRKMLIYCIKLDHALYSINYGMYMYPWVAHKNIFASTFMPFPLL